jgi:hypothetical protein
MAWKVQWVPKVLMVAMAQKAEMEKQACQVSLDPRDCREMMVRQE